MMKWIGIAILVAICSLIGMVRAWSLLKTVSLLEEFALSLQRLKVEIAFSATPLSIAVKRVSGKELAAFWTCFAQMLENGKQVKEAWEDTADMLGPIKDSTVRGIFDGLFSGLGKSDRTTQCKRIEETLCALAPEIQKAKLEAAQKGKVVRTLGVLGGIAIVIILI